MKHCQQIGKRTSVTYSLKIKPLTNKLAYGCISFFG